MGTCEDVVLAITKIKREMDKVREQQSKYLEWENSLGHALASMKEGQLLGLYDACMIIRDAFLESCPELKDITCD